MSSIARYEKYMQDCLDILWIKLRSVTENAEPVDMAVWIGHLAFDVVTNLGYGEPLGALETESDVMSLQESMKLGPYLRAHPSTSWD